MKTILILSALVLLMTQPLSSVRAEETSTGASVPAGGPSDPAKPKHEAPKLDTWDGTLEKLDAQASVFVVGGKEFKAGKRAIKVLVDGLEKTWAELRIGDKVSVAYFPRKEGACIAKKVSKGVVAVTASK